MGVWFLDLLRRTLYSFQFNSRLVLESPKVEVFPVPRVPAAAAVGASTHVVRI